jgi:signal transduction histidine kinase
MLPLESSKLFSTLAPADLAALRSVTREQTYAGGTEIFKEGDAGDALYVIGKGAVQISGVVTGGQRQIFSRLPEGEIFGEMAVVDNQPRSASAIAETETTVYRVPREAMLEMLKRSPQLAIGLMQEITHRLREFNHQYMNTVLQAERMAVVGRFASSIVHDLKNPLTIIGIAADLACQANSTAEARSVAQIRIRKQIERISTMVSDILDFTRGGGTQQPLAVLDYAGFVGPVIDEITREIEPKGVKVEIVNPVPTVKVPMNPRRLTRVFYNLMFNAVDEMPEGGTIKLHFRINDGELISEIEDTGGGIAPQMLNQLFEAFATYGKTRGTGLGLSIARRIIDEHRGRIYAKNVNGGALFGFTLPLSAATGATSRS